MTFFGDLGPRRLPNALVQAIQKSFFSVRHFQWCIEVPNGDCMQKLRPREVDVSITPIGARKPFGFLSSEVRILDFTDVRKAFGASL
jgi:hypothetical protein